MSRRQAGFAFDQFVRNVENANFGRQNQASVFCHIITGRSQPVSIQGCTKQFSIREQDCCRSVPRFHHCRIIMIKIFSFLRHEIVVCPRLRNRQHHCQRKRHAVHIQKFQCVIKHRRIRSGRSDDRIYLSEFSSEHFRRHGLLTGKHTVTVTANGIDFTIMGNHSVWMCALP